MKRWKITEKVQSVRVGRFLIIVERHVESGESHTKKKERKIESVKKDWKHVIPPDKVALSLCLTDSVEVKDELLHAMINFSSWILDVLHVLVNENWDAREKRERERGKKNRNRDHFENEIFKRWDGVNYRYVSSSGIADSVQIEPISRDLTHIFYLCSCSM